MKTSIRQETNLKKETLNDGEKYSINEEIKKNPGEGDIAFEWN